MSGVHCVHFTIDKSLSCARSRMFRTKLTNSFPRQIKFSSLLSPRFSKCTSWFHYTIAFWLDIITFGIDFFSVHFLLFYLSYHRTMFLVQFHSWIVSLKTSTSQLPIINEGLCLSQTLDVYPVNNLYTTICELTNANWFNLFCGTLLNGWLIIKLFRNNFQQIYRLWISILSMIFHEMCIDILRNSAQTIRFIVYHVNSWREESLKSVNRRRCRHFIEYEIGVLCSENEFVVNLQTNLNCSKIQTGTSFFQLWTEHERKQMFEEI